MFLASNFRCRMPFICNGFLAENTRAPSVTGAALVIHFHGRSPTVLFSWECSLVKTVV